MVIHKPDQCYSMVLNIYSCTISIHKSSIITVPPNCLKPHSHNSICSHISSFCSETIQQLLCKVATLKIWYVICLDTGYHHTLVRVWYIQPSIVMPLQHLLIGSVHPHISSGVHPHISRSIPSTEHCGCQGHSIE